MVPGSEWQQVSQPPFIREVKGSPISAPALSNEPILVHLEWRWRIREYFSCSYFAEVQLPAIRLRFQEVACFTTACHFALLLYFWTTEPFNYMLSKKIFLISHCHVLGAETVHQSVNLLGHLAGKSKLLLSMFWKHLEEIVYVR